MTVTTAFNGELTKFSRIQRRTGIRSVGGGAVRPDFVLTGGTLEVIVVLSFGIVLSLLDRDDAIVEIHEQ